MTVTKDKLHRSVVALRFFGKVLMCTLIIYKLDGNEDVKMRTNEIRIQTIDMPVSILSLSLSKKNSIL